MKYTQIPNTTFEQIQLNAGILVDSFEPSTGVVGNIIGATTGGVQFQDSVEFKDFGEDIDNCPKNMMELKKLDSHDVKMSGTFVTVSATTAKLLAGAADVDSNNSAHIIPRNDVLTTDFVEMWWVGDYSNVNTGANAGFIAIRLMNALNTGGFQIQSTDKGKGQFAFEFTGHYSMAAQDTVPYEIYVASEFSPEPFIQFAEHTLTVRTGSANAKTIHATTSPSNASITWASASTAKATVANGVVTGVATGNTIITGTISQGGISYSDTCTVIVTT